METLVTGRGIVVDSTFGEGNSLAELLKEMRAGRGACAALISWGVTSAIALHRWALAH
jgi:hypothetical protein